MFAIVCWFFGHNFTSYSSERKALSVNYRGRAKPTVREQLVITCRCKRCGLQAPDSPHVAGEREVERESGKDLRRV